MLALSPITQFKHHNSISIDQRIQHLLEANLMLGYLKLKTELLCSTVPSFLGSTPCFFTAS